jgi:hypothetical protein
MDLADIRSKVRTVVDMDTVDLPNDLLDMYVRDGYDRMMAIERRWPFLQTSATLSTVANQREYLLSSIGAGNFSDIISIFDGSGIGARLTLVSHDDAEATWGGDPEATGRPMHYSIWESKLNLWPMPNGVFTLSLRGYRKPIDWTANTTTEVDADARLHQALVYYAISQVYQLQEDVQLAAFYRSSFDENVRLVASDIMKPSSHRPMILSGQPFHDSNGFYQYPSYY